MEAANDADEFIWASDLVEYQEYQAETASVYGVKGLAQINENHVEVTVLFSTLFLHLSSCKDHVRDTSACPEATLTLWYDCGGIDVILESVMQDASKSHVENCCVSLTCSVCGA